MKKLIFGLTLVISASSFADVIVISINGKACALSRGTQISTSIKNNNYGVFIKRSSAGDSFTLRVGKVSSGSLSSILYMEDILYMADTSNPADKLEFHAGNVFGVEDQDKVHVGIYNFSKLSRELRKPFDKAPRCQNDFAE